MAWLYLSDPDNREAVLEREPPAQPASPRRQSPRRKTAALPTRRPVKGFQGRYQFVLPGFDDLVGQAAYNPRVRRAP